MADYRERLYTGSGSLIVACVDFAEWLLVGPGRRHIAPGRQPWWMAINAVTTIAAGHQKTKYTGFGPYGKRLGIQYLHVRLYSPDPYDPHDPFDIGHFWVTPWSFTKGRTLSTRKRGKRHVQWKPKDASAGLSIPIWNSSKAEVSAFDFDPFTKMRLNPPRLDMAIWSADMSVWTAMREFLVSISYAKDDTQLAIMGGTVDVPDATPPGAGGMELPAVSVSTMRRTSAGQFRPGAEYTLMGRDEVVEDMKDFSVPKSVFRSRNGELYAYEMSFEAFELAVA